MEWAEIVGLSIAFVAFFMVYWGFIALMVYYMIRHNGDGAHAQVVVPAGQDAGPDGDKTQ